MKPRYSEYQSAMAKLLTLPVLLTGLLLMSTSACAQQEQNEDWSARMTAQAMQQWPDVVERQSDGDPKWNYDTGLLLKGVAEVWKTTGNDKYMEYIQHIIDPFIGEDGTITDYEPEDHKLDDLNNGKILLLLYEHTGNEKYWKAATNLRKQINSQPRTAEGGFWHKDIYPHQMWLDGLYMQAPFYARYALMSDSTQSFDDVVKQFFLMEKNVRDPETGLMYHGFDESRDQRWADPITGRSPHFWGRAMGWYGMALVDVLDYLPQDYERRQLLINILKRFAAAVKDYQDPDTGLWFQVMDQIDREGNYPEASASNMFIYTLAKGARKGYLDRAYLDVAQKGYQGVLNVLIDEKSDGSLEIRNVNTVAGLGGDPYRDGSYEYYVTAEKKTNHVKGLGTFILSSIEIERATQ